MKKSILFLMMLIAGLVSVVSAATITYTASPINKQLYPRDVSNNLATISVSGTVEGTGPTSIMVRIWRDGVVYSETSQALVFSGSSAPFSIVPTIEAVLKNYTVDVILVQGGETLDRQVTEVVAGDAYIINGQSNASAQIDNGYASAAADERAFIRTFGVNWDAAAQTAADQIWRQARGDDSLWKSDGSIGRWGLRMGRLLTEETNVPVAILNGGRGAMAIDHFARNDANHPDLNTNYGRMFARTIWAGINNHVRAVLWYQGESDNGNKAIHEAGFMALYNDWKENYPRLERIYVHQLHVGCGVIKDQLDLREWQRTLPDTYSDIKVMSTNGNDDHDGCHYTDLGHQKGGNNIAALVAADLYGSANTANTTAPNPASIYFSSPTFDQITIVMRNPTDLLTFNAGAVRDFILPGSSITVTSGTVSGNSIILSLNGNASTATGLGYTGHQGDDVSYGPGEWVLNAAGLGMLSFLDTILPSAPAAPDAPTNLGASAGSDQVSLSWNASAGADAYVIKRDGIQIGTTASLQYVDTGLTPVTAYLYEVAASNSFGVSSFVGMSVTTLAGATSPPATPSGLNARLLESSSSVSLTWNAAAQASIYRVRRNGVEIGTTSANTFTDTGLVPSDTAYTYDVRAENNLGNSAYSTTAGGFFRAESSISNGSFEDNPVGTSVTIDSTTVIDATTFSDWRFFSIGTPPKDFSATSVVNASDWGVALKIDLTSNGAGGQDHGLDRSGTEIPVAYGNEYNFSFDAAWLSGSVTLDIIIQEFMGTAHLGNSLHSYTISNGNYQQFSEDWTPANSMTDNINIRIMPQAATGTSISLLLDNVQFIGNGFPANGLYTPSISSYAVTDHVVSTTVFHWFAATGGQLSGPWIPEGGRPSWTGQSDWWQTQVKQLMAANIDILYVHLIDQTEDIRVNLFRALNQLRYQGYDVPKVLPFLDPVVIYDSEPNVNLATTAGKDEFVGHYIRFFDQYYSVNQDAYANDYIAKTGGRVMLDTWHLHLNADNIASLSRNDVESRLLTAFGANSPFVNGIYQISPGLNFGGTLGFTDEKVIQYEEHLYFKKTSFNGVDAAQVKPGYWDQNVRNPGYILPRAGGAHYSAAWNSVNADASIDHVYIESFNEYDEGSGIYPVDIAASPYLINGNTSSDTWSSNNDPAHYIKATAAGAAVFNDTPNQDAKILWHNFPDSMIAGETKVVTVIVRNAGDASWTATTNYKLGDKADGAAAFGAARYLLDDNADEIPIYGGIFRGRTKAFQITLVAPSTPGTYATHWGMLQEGVAWFGEDLAHTFTITSGVNQAPTFTADPITLSAGMEGFAYNNTLAGTATDANTGDTLTYTKVSGPPWLNVATGGTLSGTPASSDVGANSWSVQVSDGNGGTDTATLNILVNILNMAPVFGSDPIALSDAMEASAYSDTLAGTATDADTGDSLTYTKVSGPAWLSIAPSGALSGTPALADEGPNSWSVQVSDGNGGTDTATLNIEVLTILPKDDMALSENTIFGTVSGSLADSYSNDNLYEGLTEALDGTPTSLLQHEWTFDVYGAELVTFYVEAHHTANAEGDDFVFAYSTDGSSWTDMVTVTKTTDDDTAQWYALPSELNGTVYVRVTDSDRTASNTVQDTLYVDALFIYSEDSTVAPSQASNPIPANGATTVSVEQDLIWTAGAMAVTHNLYGGTANPPPYLLTTSNAATAVEVGTLAYNTLYYWAVDEVNNTGTTPGALWSFTTELLPVTTTATIVAEGSAGVSGDLFQGATVTANSAMHPAGFLATDLFSSGAATFSEDAIFADGTGNALSFVEFNTASSVNLQTIIIGLANDGASAARAISHIKVYASPLAGTVMANLIADIPVDPDYITAYGGSSQITVSIDLSVNAQYFRVEVTESNDATGGRVMEIDGFSN